MRRRRSVRRRRSGRSPLGSPSHHRPRPVLRFRQRPPEHRRRRRPERRRRFDLTAVAVRAFSEFIVSPSTRRCPPFAPPHRRSPASMRAQAAAGGDVTTDVIVAVSRRPAVDQVDLGRPFWIGLFLAVRSVDRLCATGSP